MFWIFLAAVTVAVLFGLLGITGGRSWRLRPRQLLALVGVLWMFGGMVAVIPTGHTGILTTFGKVEDITLEAGMHIKSPFQEVVVMDNRTQKQVLNLSCFSNDIQEVEVRYTVNYQINKKSAQTIYSEIGTNYYMTVMEPQIQQAVKSVISKYTAETLIENRDKLSQEIKVILENALTVYHIEVIDASVENMDFSNAFTAAVEAKQVAAQNKLQAQIEQEQKTMEEQQKAERAQIQANAAAEVAKIQAEADLEVTRIQADAAEYAGKKDAAINEALAESLSDILLKYYEIKQWNGELPDYFVSGVESVLPILGQIGNGAESGQDSTPDAPDAVTPAN